jgi:hypothetical protein
MDTEILAPIQFAFTIAFTISIMAMPGSAECSGIKTYTKGECPQKIMQLETRFLQMLEKSRSYNISGSNLEVDCGDMGGLVFEQKRD